MSARFTIAGRMCGLNDYVAAERTNRFKAAGIKQRETERARVACVAQGVPSFPPDRPVRVRFTWYERDRRRDVDNVAFAKKFVLDGMVLAGVIRDDSRRYVAATADDVLTDRDDPRVEVEVERL